MAGRARLIQTNMGGGELSVAARARPDTDIYSGALERILNYLVRPSGAADRRPGSVYLGEARNNGTGKRWFIFRKAVNDIVRIEAGNLRFRFWSGTTRALIEASGSPVELVTPWTLEDLPGLRTWQSGDVLWFAHTGHAHKTWALKRTASNAFELAELVPEEGPFKDYVAGVATLSFTAVTGSVTITADAPSFSSDDVGALIRVEALTQPDVSSWAFDQKTVVGEFCRNGNRFYECTDTNDPFKTGNYPPVHESGVAWDGNQDDNVQWSFSGYSYGLARITAYASSTSVTATVLRRLPFYGSATKSSDYWQMSALSETEGWPACGTIVEDRVALFGSATDPDRCFLGRTNRYTPETVDMRPGFLTETLDDDAVRRSLNEGQTAYIVWALVMDGLLLGTTLGVRSLVGPSADEALTPAGAVPRTVTEIPCSVNLPPLKADNALIYAALGDEELIEVSRISDSVPRNLLEMADHMAGGGLRSYCWQGRPRRVLWAVDRLGRLVSLTYSPENGTIAWARHRLGGVLGRKQPYVDDVCSAPGPDGRDEVWLMVARSIDGAVVRSVEYLERPFDPDTMRPEDACCLDMAAYFDLWETYRVMAIDLGGGSVQLTAQDGETPFVDGDIGREFWLTQNGEDLDEDDLPSPVKVSIDAKTSSSIVTGTLVGTYPSDTWSGKSLRVARPTRTLSGLDWLEGEEVWVNADGRKLGPFTVSGGNVGLKHPGGDDDAWCARGWVGLSMRSFLRSLPVNGGEGLGTARTAVGKVTGIGVLPVGVCDGVVRRADGMEGRDVMLNPRKATAPMGTSTPVLTDDSYIPLDTGFDRTRQIEIETSSPLPCSIAGFMLKVESYG
ncbi:hypothetical protein [Hyphomonas sp.]|jgi:hypothetical protein|uniref:hypothetical protein n=1 Tax=Hyphomonas sp. TaxID=87 RepID=UPI0032EE8925